MADVVAGGVAGGTPRKAAVLGKPVAHSLSPVLHQAAYDALGLTGWTYERHEVDAEGLADFVSGLGPEWAGLSVTMPGKRAALEFVTEVTPRAAAVGAANTLVPIDGGWRADCTDVAGVVGALRAAGGFRAGPGGPGSGAGSGGAGGSSAGSGGPGVSGADSGGAGSLAGAPGGAGVVLGAGGTAAAAVAAFADLGLAEVRIVARDPARAEPTAAAARGLGLDVDVVQWSDVDWRSLAEKSAALVSTVPSEAVSDHIADLVHAPCLLDVIYHPWPTPLATAREASGGSLATGLDMLLHQAFGQVEQFTGHVAPREAMRDALRAATGDILPLPLD